MSKGPSEETASRSPAWARWLLAAVVVAFFWQAYELCGSDTRYVDQTFDASRWRAEPQSRRQMVDGLIEHVGATEYSRDSLVRMLGEPSAANDSRLSWSLGECGRAMPAYCYLRVEVGPDGVVKNARVYRD